MKSKLNKKQAQKEIEEFFSKIREKTPKEVKKIKRLAMKHNIKLKNKRKKFCKKCYFPNLRVLKIKNKIKRVKCLNCGHIGKWKIK